MNQSAAQEAAASAEMTKQAEVKVMLEQQKIASQKEKEALIMQVCLSSTCSPAMLGGYVYSENFGPLSCLSVFRPPALSYNFTSEMSYLPNQDTLGRWPD